MTSTTTFVKWPHWRLNCILFGIGTLWYAYLAYDLFAALPRLDDSVAALFQARIFAEGRLIWPIDEALKPYFDLFGVISPIDKPGYRAGMYAPGWPAMLSLGLLAGAPWIVNPILGGLLVVSIGELGRELYSGWVGWVAAIMALASPMVGVVSATHLSHTPTALLATITWWSACRLLRTGRWRYALAGGGAAAAIVLTRPESAILMLPIIAAGVLIQWRRAVRLWRPLAVFAASVVAGGILLLGWQHVTVGRAGTFGHAIEMGSKARMGFGRVGQTALVHTPKRAAAHTRIRVRTFDRHLLGWPVPLAAILLAPWFLLRARWTDLWLLAPVLTYALFFACYWYFEEWLPGRYWFPAAPMMLVLAARGLSAWHGLLAGRRLTAPLPLTFLVLGTIYSVAVTAPRYHERFGAHHGDVETALPGVLAALQTSNALVIMGDFGHIDLSGKRNDYYATGFLRNDLDLNGDVLFARDGRQPGVGRSNDELLSHFPGRRFYYYHFDQETGHGTLFGLIAREGRFVRTKRLTKSAPQASAISWEGRQPRTL